VVFEETGIEAEPVALIAVFDGMRLGFHQVPLYSLVFYCRMTGGELRGHPLETEDVGFFPQDNLPEPLAGGGRWVDLAFAAVAGRQTSCVFDPPRRPPWRVPPDEG
jgi:ADP-ribose pyrophosphatase YjhB (NUDIX family)